MDKIEDGVEELIEGSSSDDDSEEGEEEGKAINPWSKLWQGVATASIGTNIAAIVLERSIFTALAGGVACAVGPVVIKRQADLDASDSLRDVQNQLRSQANRLAAENEKLSTEVTQLEGLVDRVSEAEGRLTDITKEQGSSVDTFVALVKENKITLEKMKSAVMAETMQTLMSVVLDSDYDQSAEFEPKEIKIMLLRMKNIPGVDVNEKKLEPMILKTDLTLAAILSLIKDLVSSEDDKPKEERVFVIHAKEEIEAEEI